jgi:hypothetical protein
MTKMSCTLHALVTTPSPKSQVLQHECNAVCTGRTSSLYPFVEMVPRTMTPVSELSARVPSHTDPSLQALAWEAKHLSGPHGPGAVSSSLAFHSSSNGIERVYAEPAGVWWKVTEHLQDGCWSLVFMSAAAIRRVRTYPPDWWQLSNGELAALSWAR